MTDKYRVLSIKVSPKGSAVMPVGTTAERPAVPEEGETRANTTTGRPEVYINGAWVMGLDPASAVHTNDAATDAEIDSGSTATKFLNLPQFWRGITKKITETLQTREIKVTGAITGGGKLHDDPTIRIRDASLTERGSVQLTESVTSSSTTMALCAKAAAVIYAKAQSATNAAQAAAPKTREVKTTGPLQGGGDLTDDRTLSIQDATTAQKGATQLSDAVDSTSTVLSATANAVKKTWDKAESALAAANARVHTNRQIKTTGALQGGGDLSADRTLSVQDATVGQKGIVLLTAAVDATSNTLVVNQAGVNTVWLKAVEALNKANGKFTAVDASATVKGILKVSDAINSTDSTVAASSKAVKMLAEDIATKFTPVDATNSVKGIVQLNSSIASSSESTAATPKAVKEAYDKAAAGYNLAGTKFTAVDASATVKGIVKLSDRVDSASQVIAANLQGVRVAYDKGVSAHNLAGTKWAAVDASPTVKGIALLNDSVTSASSTVSASSKAVKTAMDMANSKWAAVDATATVKGIVRLYNGVDSTTIVQAATANAVKQAYDKANAAYNLANGRAPAARQINTTGPLQGGGDLTANRTLSIANASTSAKGAVQLDDAINSTSTTRAGTANAVKKAYDKAVEALSKAGAQLSPSRRVNTTGALHGGGALSSDLNLTVDTATTARKGVVQLNDGYNSTSTVMAPTAKALKTTYDLAAGKLAAGGTAKNSEKLDGQPASSFIRANANDIVTAVTTWADGKAPTIFDDNDGGRIPAPGGGYYNSAGDVLTGPIKIKLPTVSKGKSDMISFEAKVYNYQTGLSFTVLISGYQHAQNGWANVSATILGFATAVDHKVRFGYDGTSHCIWIGETASVWHFLKVGLFNFVCGHDALVGTYASGWSISVPSAFDTVALTLTGNLPASRYSKDGALLGGKSADTIINEARAGKADDSDKLAGLTHDSYQRTKKWTGRGITNAYKTIAYVNGSGLGSIIRLNGRGTTDGLVMAFSCDIIVNHSNDIIISGISGAYTPVSIKIISGGNEDYYIQIRSNITAPANIFFTAQSFCNEVITGYDNGQTPNATFTIIKELTLGLNRLTCSGHIESKGELHENGHRVFSSGNRNITDSLTNSSNTLYASALAVKNTYSKAVAAYNLANAKWAAVDASTSVKGILKLYDGVNSGATTTAPTSRVMKVTYDLASRALPASGTAKNSEKLGAQAPSAWLRRNTNQTIIADYTFDNKGVGSVSGTGGTVMMPGGGQLITSAGTVQGAIKIKFPVATKNNNCMHTMEVAVFDCVTDKTFTVRISGYHYSNTLWTNTTAVIMGASSAVDHAIRFGHDGTSHCVWIGEANYNWKYPKVSILNYMGGHSGPINGYLSGWNVSIRTTFDTVQHTRTTNLIAAGAASYASKLSTPRAIAVSGDCSGSVQFDGSGNVSIPVTVKDDSHYHSQVYIPDTRGAKRPPSYYPDRYVSYDFQNKADTDAGGATWNCLQTIAKWSSFNNDHAQEQICYTGGRIKHRVATSDTAWGAWKTLAYTTDMPPAATYSVAGIVKLTSDTSKTYSDVAATIKAVNSVKNIATSKWAMVRASTSVEGIVQLSNAIDSNAPNRAATSGAVKMAYDKAVEALNAQAGTNDGEELIHHKSVHDLGFTGNTKTYRIEVTDATRIRSAAFAQNVATSFFIILETDAVGNHAITIPGSGDHWYPGKGSQQIDTSPNTVNILQGIHVYNATYYNISTYQK